MRVQRYLEKHWRMILTILRAVIDPTGATRSQRGWRLQVLPQALLAVN
jgi:hypothetical protein